MAQGSPLGQARLLIIATTLCGADPVPGRTLSLHVLPVGTWRRRYNLGRMTMIKAAKVERLGRGGGVVSVPLITRKSAGEENKITTGISVYPVGTGATAHTHNCDEHVTLLAGTAEGEIAGEITP